MSDEPHIAHRFAPDSRTRVVLREVETQRQHLDSVSARISGAILEFFRLHDGLNFFADDLRKYVTSKAGVVAPGSADRVMRDLRQKNLIAYRCVNRAQSLYRAGS